MVGSSFEPGGPVDYDRYRCGRSSLGLDGYEEPAVRADIETNCVAKRDMRIEQRLWCVGLEPVATLHRDGHHLAIRAEKKQVPAIASPRRNVAAIRGHLPFAARLRES